MHAAAGGVGLLLVQMAHNIGARVIATVSTDEKAKLAREAGADEVILYTQSDFEAETKRLTGGKGVDVVYDSVGKTTFEKGLNVLRPRGMMVLFGGSSGAVPPFDLIISDAEGIALRDAALAGQLHRDARRVGGAVGRGVWHDGGGKAETADRAYLSAGRGAAGASRSGRPEDDGEVAADPVGRPFTRLSSTRLVIRRDLSSIRLVILSEAKDLCTSVWETQPLRKMHRSFGPRKSAGLRMTGLMKGSNS